MIDDNEPLLSDVTEKLSVTIAPDKMDKLQAITLETMLAARKDLDPPTHYLICSQTFLDTLNYKRIVTQPDMRPLRHDDQFGKYRIKVSKYCEDDVAYGILIVDTKKGGIKITEDPKMTSGDLVNRKIHEKVLGEFFKDHGYNKDGKRESL